MTAFLTTFFILIVVNAAMMFFSLKGVGNSSKSNFSKPEKEQKDIGVYPINMDSQYKKAI